MVSLADLLLDPMTAAEIEAKREETSFENSPAFSVLMYTPLPIVDMVAGAVVAAADYAIRGDRGHPWRNAWGAAKRDWSGSTVAQRYVEKVRAQGRELVNAEVESLEQCVKMGNVASAAASAAAGAVADAVSQAVSNTVNNAVASSAQALRDSLFGSPKNSGASAAGASKSTENPADKQR